MTKPRIRVYTDYKSPYAYVANRPLFALEETLGVLARDKKAMASVPTRFAPRDGLGLYVKGAEASFRNVVLEPLPQNP
jgi:hypothetical protein